MTESSLVRQLYLSNRGKGCHENDMKVWHACFDETVSAIQDPDHLAEDAANAGLISATTKELILGAGLSARDRALTILLTIDSQMRENPQLLHTHMIAVLKRQQGLERVVSALQASYDESTEEIDVERNSSDSEISSCSPRQLQDPEEPQYIYISSGEESIVEEENIHQQERERLTRSLCTGGAGAVTTPTAELSVPTTVVQQSSSQTTLTIELDLVIDAENRSFKHLGQIADSMHEWQGRIADELELTLADVAGIKSKQPTELKLQVREALQIWKQRNGSAATYRNLIGVFERAGYQEYADTVRRIALVRKRNHDDVDDPCTKVPRIEDTPLMRFRPKLGDFYSKKPEVPETTWPPVKRTHYVNLALIKPQPMNYSKDYVRQTVRGSIDDIFKDKEEIKYEDTFNKHDDKLRIMIILEGRPGCGKTTLMHKLSQDWGKGEVLSSYLLFLVHLRRFNNRSDIHLADILQAAYPDFTEDDTEQMCKLIEESGGRGVVFALDGLDEYSPKADNFVYSIIEGRRLTNAVVIVASRPAATQPFRSYASKHVEVLGFLEPQIYEYINNYFTGCPDKARGLLDYLKRHLNIMHMCYLPLHVAMVTHLYEIEGADLPQTETEIYCHFTLSTLIRSSRKRCLDSRPSQPFKMCNFHQLSPDDQAVFNIVLTLAFNSTVESRQVFSLEQLREYIPGKSPSCGDDESTLGLIVVDRYFVKYGLDEIYSFIHLTLQEYLSSLYIANQTDEEQRKIIASHGSNRSLAEVWKFYCGIGKCSHENFELLSSKIQTTIKKYQTQSMLLHLHCCYESQKEWTCTHIVNTYYSCIKLSKQSVNPSDMTALGYVMSRSETPLKKLVISSCYVGPEGLSALAMEIRENALALELLSFKGTKIKSEMVDNFADLLKFFSSIQELNLSSSISKSTLKGITEKIPPLPSVKTLDISSNQLGSTSSTAKAFLDKLPNLQTLIVHLYKDCKWYVSAKKNNQFQNINVKTIVPSRISLEQLDLATCTELALYVLKISDKEAEVIGERLKECPNLSKLNLGGNKIEAAGAQAIAEGLKLCPNLQTIELQYNQLGDAGAQAIADGCKLCPSLQTIKLEYNQIGDAGAQAIADGCKLCPNLQTLDLWRNSITDASVPHLVGLIQTARKLKTLNLNFNKFTDAGRSQLGQAAGKRNNDQANYVHLSLGVVHM